MKLTSDYILGIDIGISSLGAAIVQLNKDTGKPCGVLDAGVRIFPVPEGAEARRITRQQRKNLRRRKTRIRLLKQLMLDTGLLPHDPAEMARLMKRPPYQLRAAGVRTPFDSPWRLGRCILHMAKTRGPSFLSQMDEDGQEPKDRAKTAQSYRMLEQELTEKNLTVAQYMAQRLRRTPPLPVKRRKRFLESKAVDHAVPRFLVRKEFHALWEKQAGYHEQLTPELKKRIEGILFFEHPRAPYAVGPCSLLGGVDPDQCRLPRMHRLSELRRIYESVNNIRIKEDFIKRPLTRKERDELVAHLLQGNKLTKTSLKKMLGIKHKAKLDMDDIQGLAHINAFADTPRYWSMSEQEQDELLQFIADPRIPGDKLDRLMPEEQLLETLAIRLDAPRQAVEQVLARLPKGRARLGLKATKEILKRLQDGSALEDGTWRPLSMREAADACAFLAEEEHSRSLQNACEFLPYYGQLLYADIAPVHPWHKKRAAPEEARYGRAANPVVHVALNQLRRVVNEIIERHGKPSAIHVELSREFGKSAQQRKEMEQRNKDNRATNEKHDDALRELGFKPTYANRIKYKLLEEQGGVDIFTLKKISPKDLNSMEIEHLIPRAAGGSDTIANLALVNPNENRAKGDLYPYEFLSSRENFQQIIKHVRERLPENKAWRFESDARERFESQGDQDATSRLMTDTSYMAKLAARYLRAVTPSVVCVKGGYTAKFRHAWGLDGLEYELLPLPISKNIYDQQTGEQQRNPLWFAKPRIDHRHHALDALVVACVSRSMVQQLGKAYNRGLEYDYSQIPAPWGHEGRFRDDVLRALQQLRVSHKPDHDPSGKLHEETLRHLAGEHPQKKGLYITRYARAFSLLKTRDAVSKIIFDTKQIPLLDDRMRQDHALLQRIRELAEAHYPAAQAELEAQNAEQKKEGLKPVKVTENRIVQTALQHARKQLRLAASYPCYENLQSAFIGPNNRIYKSGNNHCMTFFVKANGQIGWELTTRSQACDKSYTPLWRQQGLKRLWTVHNGDLLEMDTPEDALDLVHGAARTLMQVQKMSDGRLQVMLANDARPKPTEQFKGLAAHWNSGARRLRFFTEAGARKVELTDFGKVIRKHKALWHGKKPQT